MHVTIDHRKEEAPGIITTYFKPEKSVSYTAGQFIEFNLKHNNPDERGVRRWFTLSSAPEDDFLTITTRYAGKNSSSFKRALMNMPEGSGVTFSPPEGDFTLPKDEDTKLIFVAGGIGITPMHSMVSHLLQSGEARDIRLLYGVNTLEDAVFMETFDDYHVDVELVVTKPAPSWNGATGRITAEQIITAAKDSDNYLIYLSGPEPMVETLDKDLKAKGVDKKHIKTDFFPGYNHI